MQALDAPVPRGLDGPWAQPATTTARTTAARAMRIESAQEQGRASTLGDSAERRQGEPAALASRRRALAMSPNAAPPAAPTKTAASGAAPSSFVVMFHTAASASPFAMARGTTRR